MTDGNASFVTGGMLLSPLHYTEYWTIILAPFFLSDGIVKKQAVEFDAAQPWLC